MTMLFWQVNLVPSMPEPLLHVGCGSAGWAIEGVLREKRITHEVAEIAQSNVRLMTLI
jgi:hypothetical protein